MSFAQFIIIPVFVSFQAFALMLLAPYVSHIPGNNGVLGTGLVTWIVFQAWAMFFMAGCSVKMAMKTIFGYIGGIVASIAIFELGDILSQYLGGGYWGYAVAVFIVVIFIISAERVPGLDFIPAWFVGAGVFFAFVGGSAYMKEPIAHTLAGYQSVAIPEMTACVVGLIFGYITVAFRTRYEKSIAAKSKAPAA